MALNLDKIRSRLTTLSSTNKTSDQRSKLIWKPSPGKQTIRIVPYAKDPENPFIELKFHYNMNGRTYLSPDTFNRPDPIVEFSNKLKSTGDKDEWRMGKKLEPKMRTFAPIIVRGAEEEGVKFWGFGKQVYESLLSVIADPDYGDITDLASGRDVVVEFKTAKETGKEFPTTSIMVKPNRTPAVDPNKKELIEGIKDQPDVLDLFSEPSYEELKTAMDAWLHTSDEESVDVSDDNTTVSESSPSEEAEQKESVSPSASTSKENAEDITKAFDNLFGN